MKATLTHFRKSFNKVSKYFDTMNFNNPIPAQVFQLWTEFETYKVGVQFSMKEFNRRFNLLGRVRHLNDDDPDLPKSLEGKVCIITGGSRGK